MKLKASPGFTLTPKFDVTSRREEGFTLIELLVVISIIGLLSSIMLVAVNNARSKARDARRKGDMRQVVTMLEMYMEKYGKYPTPITPNCRADGWCVDSSPQDGKNPVNDWIPGLSEFGKLPHNPLPYGTGVDASGNPTTGWSYHYYSTAATPAQYMLLTMLESKNDPVTCGGGTTHYWINGDSTVCSWVGWGPSTYIITVR
jgi:prepilin-type N-terminal cleavage/methylation domain-containing protein